MRKEHELTVPELLAKIEKLTVWIKAYGEGFEAGRKFEISAAERDDNEMW